MQPDNTPAISRYIVQAINTGGTWAFTEIFNTTGSTITPTRAGTTIVLTADKDTFEPLKTFVTISPAKTAGIQYLINSITAAVVTIEYNQPANDTITIQVESINI